MSIVTYENVDTPVFEIDLIRYLFTDGAQGLYLPYQPDHLYADVDKTVPAVFGGGVASFDDLSGNGVTGPQSVSTARPIFRASPARGEYDSADDVLPHNATLPAITDGTVILIGQQGIWIDEGYSFAGGNWSFGPTTYTGGPEGIIGVVGDMLDLVVMDRPLTADERDRVVTYGVKRGSAGVFELGPELHTDPELENPAAWDNPGESMAGGQATITSTNSLIEDNITSFSAQHYLQSVDIESKSGGTLYAAPSRGPGYAVGALTVTSNESGVFLGVTRMTGNVSAGTYALSGTTNVAVLNRVSLKELILNAGGA